MDDARGFGRGMLGQHAIIPEPAADDAGELHFVLIEVAGGMPLKAVDVGVEIAIGEAERVIAPVSPLRNRYSNYKARRYWTSRIFDPLHRDRL